jgi:leucyl-tRNA synthetase
LKKLWRLYFDENGLIVTNDAPTRQLEIIAQNHQVAEDIEGSLSILRFLSL